MKGYSLLKSLLIGAGLGILIKVSSLALDNPHVFGSILRASFMGLSIAFLIQMGYRLFEKFISKSKLLTVLMICVCVEVVIVANMVITAHFDWHELLVTTGISQWITVFVVLAQIRYYGIVNARLATIKKNYE